MKKGTKQVTQQEFDNIKLLIQAGLKNSVVSKVTGRSVGFVAVARRSDSLDEARAIQRANKNYKPVVETQEVSEAVERTQSDQIIQLLTNLTDIVQHNQLVLADLSDACLADKKVKRWKGLL
jgi:hypothetical protein